MNEVQPTRLFVIRHGETIWNSEGRQQGHLNSNLTELGKKQARAAAAALERVKFDALYSSDLGRAMETAEIIAGRLGLEVIPDRGLRERNLGIIQGLTFKELESRYPEVHHNYITGNVDDVIPEGESVRQRYERNVACAAELASRHPGGQILLVAHGGVLDSLLRRTLNIPLDQRRTFSLFNASVNVFIVSNDGWKLESWGVIDHLLELNTLDDS